MHKYQRGLTIAFTNVSNFDDILSWSQKSSLSKKTLRFAAKKFKSYLFTDISFHDKL